MTTIYLIRHGQASIGTDNYDVLSTLGKRQSEVLGDHLRDLRIKFSAFYSGTLKRQMDTATLSLMCQPPQLVSFAGFNEYQHSEIYQHYAPGISTGALFDHPNEALKFDTFAVLMNAWAQDTAPENEAIESFSQFNERINKAIEEVLARHERSDTIAIFTSGGVICTLLQSALGFPVSRIFEINWGIYNTSISKLKYHNGELKLREYNNITHLLLKRDFSLVTNI